MKIIEPPKKTEVVFMLEDLSAHVLDIAENSVRAEASDVTIEITEDVRGNIMRFSVQDNGKGMTEEFVERVTDPFTTTRTARRVGMGLPFLQQSAELCGGSLEIKSKAGTGTKTTATFLFDSVDRPPLGDMAATVMTLIMGAPEIHWLYRHTTNKGEFELDTDELLEALDGERDLLRSADVGLWIRDKVKEGLTSIGSGA